MENKTTTYFVAQFRKFYLHPTESNSADGARKDHLEFFIPLKTLYFKGEIERAFILGFRLPLVADELVLGPWKCVQKLFIKGLSCKT